MSSNIDFIDADEELNAYFKSKARRRINKNNDRAQTELENLLKRFAGWRDVEEWAREMIRKIRDGQRVNLDQLRQNIQEWEQNVYSVDTK